MKPCPKVCPLGVPILYFVLGIGLAGCETADIGISKLTAQSYTREIGRLIEEDGYNFIVELEGADAGPVPIQLWSSSGFFLGGDVGAQRGSRRSGNAYTVFVPYDRMGHARDGKIVVYIVAENEPDKHVDTETFTFSNLPVPNAVWEFLSVQFEETSSGGASTMVVRANLHTTGLVGRDLKVSLGVRDKNGDELPASESGPIRLRGPGLASPRPGFGVYRNLNLVIPYHRLAKIDPTRLIKLTPIVSIDGIAHEGKVHVFFWPGGSLDDITRRTQDEINRFDDAIDAAERRLRALRP